MSKKIKPLRVGYLWQKLALSWLTTIIILFSMIFYFFQNGLNTDMDTIPIIEPTVVLPGCETKGLFDSCSSNPKLQSSELLKISESIEQEIQNQLPGEILINIPNEMTLSANEKVEIRIAKRIKNLKKGLRGKGIPEIETIKISPIMKIRLIGYNFDIKALSDEVQPITNFDFTQWEWEIIPREVGNQSLEVSVSLIIKIPQINETLTKDYPVYEKRIKVKVSQFEIMKLLILGLIVLLFLWIIINNRSKLTTWIKRKKFNNSHENFNKVKSQFFKSVRIVLGNGNLGIGFPSITVQILSERNILPIQYLGELPPAPEIIEVYHDWQSQYNRFMEPLKSSRMERKQGNINNFSKVDIDKLAEELEKKLNNWLKSSSNF